MGMEGFKSLISFIGRGGVDLDKPEAGHLRWLSFPAMTFSDPSSQRGVSWAASLQERSELDT